MEEKMVKLSSLSNDTMLVVGEQDTMTKEEYLRTKEDYEGDEVYTTTTVAAGIDARRMLEDAIECECCDNMYEDWYNNILGYITDDDIAKIQSVIDEILSRNPSQNRAWHSDKLVEIDM